MQLALLVSYPALLHLAYMRGSSLLASLALGFLVLGIFYKPLRHRNPRVLTALFITALILGLSAYWQVSLLLAKLPALFFPVVLFIVFAGSLMPGREALVTSIGENARGPLSEAMRRYTRFITQLWAGIFLIIIVFTVLAAGMGGDNIWSLLTNIVIYPLVGIVFVGEFYLRKLLFPDHNHPGFIEYLKIVTSAGITRPGK